MTITIGINECIAVFSAILALFSTYFAYRQYWHFIKEKKNQMILNKKFGSELFGKETIERSTYCYVEPNCTNVDPTREAEPKNLCMVRGNIFSVIDDYLLQELPKKNSIHHILILADSGMGKTSFLLNYYAYNQEKSKKRRQRITLVPLGMPNVDKYIDQIKNKENAIIFLDAFDEDTKAIKDHRERLNILMEKCHQFKRVVITCRTQFFPTDEEIPKETGIIKVAPRKAGEQGIYIFNKLYLSPLSDKQVDEYLKKRFKWNRKKRKIAKLLIQKIPNLKVRPMLLAYIPDLIDSGHEDIQNSYQLYEIMIDNWLEREKRWVKNKEGLRQFSEKLAFDLYINRGNRGHEKIPFNELSVLAKEWNIQLEDWQLTGRSLLNRDAEGNYKFAHRSIMEFLFIVHFFKMKLEERTFIEWSDQQKLFCLEFLHLSTADLSSADLTNTNLENIKLKNVRGLPEWVQKGMDKEGVYTQRRLIEAIKKGFKNLEGAYLINADLKKADLRKANLNNASLRNARGLPEWVIKGIDKNGIFTKELLVKTIKEGFKNLAGAYLINADLKFAELSSANLSYTDLENAELSEANLENADLIGAYLINADLKYTELSETKFKNARGLPEWVIKGIDENGVFKKELLAKAINKGFNNLEDVKFKNTKGLPEWFIKGMDEKGLYTIERLVESIKKGFKKIDGVDLKNVKGVPEWVQKGMDEKGVYRQERLVESIKNARRLPEWVIKGIDENEVFTKELLVKAIKKGYNNLEDVQLKDTKGMPEWVQKGMDEKGVYTQERLIESIRKGLKKIDGVNLKNADLKNADLNNADLSFANLENAVLICANLSGANIANANLSEANLSGAILMEANLTNIKLTNVNLENTCLLNAKGLPEWVQKGMDEEGLYTKGRLVKAIKQGVNLKNANLENTNLESANFESTDLCKANLKGANLTNANLTNANLKEADLTTTNLTKADLKKADLYKANLTDANLKEANLTDANLESAKLESVNLYKAILESVNLYKANLKRANLSFSNLSHADLRFSNLLYADLYSANLIQAKLYNAKLLSAKNIPEWIIKRLDLGL